ncbi:unnamed protein product [Clonostachys rosea]|uniref:F-box domain-containing protein n=1 Tax=Bionectria ochroleuca TaxID=29856 RepID=A0ABY6UAC2_BIOOC|nr:unnamed protein product [Clonostachys rosea]
MSPIEELPSEIVAQIANSSLRGPKHLSSLKDFSALARSSSHFYSILNYLLYQHNIKHGQPHKSCVLWAARHGSINTLKRAHSYGADLNIDGSRNESDFTIPLRDLPCGFIATALHLSIRHEHMDIFRYLLDQKVDIDTPSRELCSCTAGRDVKIFPLHTALCHSTNPLFAQDLIAKGAYLVAKKVPAILYMEQLEGYGEAINHLLQKSEPLAMGASLQYAVRKKRLDLIRELLEKEADIAYKNPSSDQTVLHVALDDQVPDLEVLKLLLAHPKAPLTITGHYRMNPIHFCASKPELVEAMKLLLAHPNANLLPAARGRATAFHLAAKSGSAPMFSLLLRHAGANLNDLARWHGRDKLLHLALHYIVDNLDIVKFLLEQPGAPVSLPGGDMKTPLHICAANPASLEVAKLLLAHPSIEPPECDSSGNTPLLRAAKSGSIPMIELLLSQPEVNVSTADVEGLTPLHVCAANPALVEVAQRLLAHPTFSIEPQGDRNGATPLLNAAKSGSLPMIRLILSQPGIDVSAANTLKQTPLHVCAANPELVEATKLLLAHPDIQTTVEDIYGMSPVACAAKSGSIAMFDLLADRPEVDISSRGDGQSVLDVVCSSSENEETMLFIEYLLDRGAPINGGLHADDGPLYCAISEHNLEIALMLLSRGASLKVNIDARHDWSTLHYLLQKPHPRQTEVLRELLARRAVPDQWIVRDEDVPYDASSSKTDETPLFFALASANNVECAKLLLDAGANADAVSTIRSGIYSSQQSMLAALFRKKFRDPDSSSITEGNVESIKQGVVLLLQRGTSIGPIEGEWSAFRFASDAAHYVNNWALLNLLLGHATRHNIHPDHVQELIANYGEDAVELTAALARFKEKLLAEHGVERENEGDSNCR